MALTLWISLCLLFSLYVGAVRNCYPGCRCEVESFGLFDSFSLTKVDCSGVGPDVAPIPIPLDTTYLDLSSNSIRTIPDSMLSGPGYTTLVSLDLSHNHITGVSRSTFSKLRYLETLDLSHNALEDLTDGCFSGLPLSEVDLSHNKIREFRLDILTSQGHGKPISVDLSQNLLTAVWRSPQTPPPNIQSLSLAGNRLTSVPKLRDVPLRHLNLDGNPVVRIEGDAFAGLKDLAHLSLSSLPELLELQPHSFRGLESLQVLDLSGNPKVKSLPNSVLSHLPSIRRITLRKDVHCWKTQKQEQFHWQVGRTKGGEVLTCEVAGLVS
uniref:Tsukushi n=1 Tax=Lepisosteus oculatus TaxID=7918 RepID=W5LYH0_LEPOC